MSSEILAVAADGVTIRYGALWMGGVMLFFAALSYLGVGIQFPRASWGAMLADANAVLGSAWWYMLFPGVALLVTALVDDRRLAVEQS